MWLQEADSNNLVILHVEDNDGDARLIELALESSVDSDISLTRVTTAQDAVAELSRQDFGIILLDLTLPDSHGLDTLKNIKSKAASTAVVVITGADEQSIGLLAVKNGAQDYLSKDEVNDRTLARSIRYALERNSYDQRVLEMACIDSLTGLPNRIKFTEYLEQIIKNSARLDINLFVLFIDCDHFKLINDSFGHSIGDEFLSKFASTIKTSVRASDFVARLGGDEFVIAIQSSKSDIQSPLIVAEKIQTVLASGLRSNNGIHLNARCSIGITAFDPTTRSSTPSQLLYEADTAMYTVKKNGGNGINFYDQALETKASRRKQLLSCLPNALSRGEFLLHYQPIANAQTKKVEGLEALLRWNRNGEELVSPVEFIPLLEECSLIHGVGQWVLTTAIEEFKKIKSSGLLGPSAWISVNVSPAQIHDLSFVGRVTTTLKESRIEPGDLTLEVTESLLLEQNPITEKTISAISQLGCHWAIDDFGVGYSSMSYLKNLPFNRLKIDRSFVSGVCNTPEESAIIKAMIALAHALGMEVVAEGVEALSEWEFLEQNTCNFIQGFYFAKPMAPPMLREFLSEHARQPIKSEGNTV